MKPDQPYALITGGTSGIGYQLAKLFAKYNYNLLIVGRNQKELDNTADELCSYNNNKTEVIPIAKDLFKTSAAFELYDEIKARNINVDVLVNNAGHGQYGEFITTDINKELDIIQLNIISLVILTKLFLKDMVYIGKGKILNLSSMASSTPNPWQSVYHASKAFVQSFTEGIRSEVKNKNITVTALLPGATDTDFFRKADMLDSKIVQEGQLADAAQVAKDGFEGLMRGDDKVISGFSNKIQVALNSIIPDDILAESLKKKQAPAIETQN